MIEKAERDEFDESYLLAAYVSTSCSASPVVPPVSAVLSTLLVKLEVSSPTDGWHEGEETSEFSASGNP